MIYKLKSVKLWCSVALTGLFGTSLGLGWLGENNFTFLISMIWGAYFGANTLAKYTPTAQVLTELEDLREEAFVKEKKNNER